MDLISFEAYELLKKTGDTDGIFTTMCNILHLNNLYAGFACDQYGLKIIKRYIQLGLLIELTGNIDQEIRKCYLLPTDDIYLLISELQPKNNNNGSIVVV